MQISDDTLMAYADGELDQRERADVQRAIAGDPALAERARRHAALRDRLQAAFEPVLDEPVPERLLHAMEPAAGATPATVVNLVRLDDARAARSAKSGWGWAQWGGMAASLLLGVVVARLVPSAGDASPFETQSGRLVARGAVAQALSQQLASAAGTAGRVAVQLSFIDKSGAYCRTFTSTGLAGVACRDGADWAVQMVVPFESGVDGHLRQAGTTLPAAVLGAVDQRIQGDPLDAQGEQAALQQAWQR